MLSGDLHMLSRIYICYRRFTYVTNNIKKHMHTLLMFFYIILFCSGIKFLLLTMCVRERDLLI